MIHSRGLPCGLVFSSEGLRALQDAGPLNEGEFDRLLCRAEVELADPEAVRRHEIIGYLKLAAAPGLDSPAGNPHAEPAAQSGAVLRVLGPRWWWFLSRLPSLRASA